MMPLRSTTSRWWPALIRSVRRSPNLFEVLLSIRPVTATTVTSPACCSAISIVGVPLEFLGDHDDVARPVALIGEIVHQGADEWQSQPPDLAGLQAVANCRRSRPARVERPGIVPDLGPQRAVRNRQDDDDAVPLLVVVAIRDGVVQQLVE